MVNVVNYGTIYYLSDNTLKTLILLDVNDKKQPPMSLHIGQLIRLSINASATINRVTYSGWWPNWQLANIQGDNRLLTRDIWHNYLMAAFIPGMERQIFIGKLFKIRFVILENKFVGDKRFINKSWRVL